MKPKRKNSDFNNGQFNDTDKNTASFKQKKVRRFSLRRKLPLSILLSLALPLTVCFFGPFEMYCGNIEEFLFSLGDFLPWCIGTALVVATVIYAVLMLLDGLAYIIVCALTLWAGVMAFLQRYYLNMGINALVGDGVGISAIEPSKAALNTVIWVWAGIALAALVFLLAKKKKLGVFFMTTAMLAIIVIATQTIGFVSLSFTTDAYTSVTERNVEDGATKGPSVLTFENITELSEENNVIFFLVDRFDVKYYEKLLKSEPDFFDGLDGFTFYNDYTSLYCRTYPAVSSILTGKENTFENTRLNYFKEIYTDGGYLRQLHDSGYSVNVYSEKYYVYDDASYMGGYVDNISGVNGYSIDSEFGLFIDMLRLSMSEYLPFLAKGLVGDMSTPEFNAHAIYEVDEPAYDCDMKAVYDYIGNSEFSTVENDGNFSFIHIYGCHTPVSYDLEWNEADDTEKNDSLIGLKQSFMIINEYLNEMRRLGLYEDATIIITGDHPAALSDSKLLGEASKSDDGTRVTAMLFKASGDSGTALKTSTAQISQDELWATIFESEGLTSLKKGKSFFDIPEGEDRVRRYLFERSVKVGDGRADEIVEYRIYGSARNGENWEIYKTTVVGKIYK